MVKGQNGRSESVAVFEVAKIPDHELFCLIGQGAYGEVWMARNAIGTLRAVKVVHRQSFQRAEEFDREFKGLLKFEPISRSHDGFVDILQIGRRDDGGVFYYVMELADSVISNQCSVISNPSSIIRNQAALITDYSPKTLRSELQERGALPPTECVTLGLKLAAALEHLHAHGLVHRDIKPSNIIFVNGEPKLADIGLVTAIDEAHSLVGTAGYIPPEGPGTPQADLYSLGKVLYEIAFGKDRQEFPQLPPDLQSQPDYTALLELNEVILKSCETDPRRRYRSAEEMRTDLASLQDGNSVKQARTRRRYWAVARKLAVSALVALLLVAGFMLRRVVNPQHTPNAEVEHLYKLGQWHFNQLTSEHHIQALKFLTEATQMDPKFTKPYGELTYLYVWNLLPDMTNDQRRLERVNEIARKAMASNPKAAEGHMALSCRSFLNRNWHGAEAEIREAIRINPDRAIARDIYVFYLTILERFDEAHREAERAEALQPPEAERVTAIVAAFPYMGERRFDGAIKQLRRVLDLDEQFGYGHNFLGWCYEWQSNYLAAIQENRKALVELGEDPGRVAAVYDELSRAYANEGERGYLRKSIELILAEEDLPDDQQLLDVLSLPGYYARLGEKEKAIEALQRHFDEPQVWHQIKFIATHDSLRGDKRFQALVKRAGLDP